jgi:hypothetical protein
MGYLNYLPTIGKDKPHLDPAVLVVRYSKALLGEAVDGAQVGLCSRVCMRALHVCKSRACVVAQV